MKTKRIHGWVWIVEYGYECSGDETFTMAVCADKLAEAVSLATADGGEIVSVARTDAPFIVVQE